MLLLLLPFDCPRMCVCLLVSCFDCGFYARVCEDKFIRQDPFCWPLNGSTIVLI